MEQDWRGPVNQLLYGLIFSNDITNETVQWNADDAVQYQTLSLGPAVYYDAIVQALDTGAELDQLHQLPQFSQTQVAEFLRAVARRLDDLRPWPEPKFVQINDPTAWTQFGRGVPIAQLNASVLEVTNILRKAFTPETGTEPAQHVLMLKLATGETVALRGAYALGGTVSLLSDAVEDRDTVLRHFIDATGIPGTMLKVIPPVASGERDQSIRGDGH